MKKWFLILLSILLAASLACARPAETAVLQNEEQPEASDAPKAQVPDPEPKETKATEETPPPPPEEPEYEPIPDEYLPLQARICGEWYADYAGLMILLLVNEEGSYMITTPGADPLMGRWETKDGLLILDGKEDDALVPVNGVLRWDSANMLFTREQPKTYLPADPVDNAGAGAFDGYWKAQFIAVGEEAMLCTAAWEDTFVYIEGTNVALGGSYFGNVIRVFDAEDGALTLSEEGMNVTIRIQKDGFLRLTVAGETSATLYLIGAPVPEALKP